MQWVLKILRKRLEEEKRWLGCESIAHMEKKYAESVRMAKERIPQLEQAIDVLKDLQPKVQAHKAVPQNQLEMFNS